MDDSEKPGSFYLGKIYDPSTQHVQNKPLLYDSRYLTTHAVCVGMTGSGKTGLGIDLLEESALNGIPAIVIDPKGDLGNLLLTFPRLTSAEFLPWIDQEEATRKKQTLEQFAESISQTWKEGLKSWGMSQERIQKLKNSAEMVIYTPASRTGIPLSILNSFSAPSDELLLDPVAIRDKVLSTTSSLLGLLGIEADPIQGREHILLSTIMDHAWREKKDLDLPTLIQQILKPPFNKVGVFDTETFYPQKDRQALSMRLNNLLASPGFQAWLMGEPLSIQNLLYTKEGKPKLSILTIAHLSDSERMFFVTLLLNELLGWVRRQSGTSNLKALLYMDEIFGYFPPTAMPPSKLPMLTLLKQARAFGLGIVLTTQNPVDLDYKGLSNCGTWFIGKLQTERDKARVIEGLNTASNGELNTAALNKMIASCGNRVFILRSVYYSDPLLFQTRWTISYLRGPLTLPQIDILMAGKAIPQELPRTPLASKAQKAEAPMGVQEYFVVRGNQSTPSLYQARVLGIGKLHFIDSKKKVDSWEQVALIAPQNTEGSSLQWENGEDISTRVDKLSKIPPEQAAYEELPAFLMQAKNYLQFNKDFAEYLYQNKTFDLFEAMVVKIISKPEETEAEFRERVATLLREKLEEDVKKVRDGYASKIKTLQDRINRAQGKAETQKSQVWRQAFDTFISIGATILGILFGKRGISKGTITQAGTSIRKAERITKEHQDAARAEESLGSLQQQLQDLQNERDREVAEAMARADPNKIDIEKTSIRPRKSDIKVNEIALVWYPRDNKKLI